MGLNYSFISVCGYCPYKILFEASLLNDAQIATVLSPSMTLLSTNQTGNYSSVGECLFPAIIVARGFASGDPVFIGDEFGIIEDIFNTQHCGYYGESGIQADIDIWGDFPGTAHKPFLGFKIPVTLGYEYAWLRLSADPFTSDIYVTEKAYQNTPNAGLIIEMPATGIGEESSATPLIITHGHTIQIAQADGYRLQMINLQGAIISTEIIHTSNYTQSLNLPAGIYIASLQKDNQVVSKKFVIQ